MFFHSSGGKKSEITIAGPKARCPSKATFLCLLQLLGAPGIPWLVAHHSSVCLHLDMAFIPLSVPLSPPYKDTHPCWGIEVRLWWWVKGLRKRYSPCRRPWLESGIQARWGPPAFLRAAPNFSHLPFPPVHAPLPTPSLFSLCLSVLPPRLLLPAPPLLSATCLPQTCRDVRKFRQKLQSPLLSCGSLIRQ